LKTQKKESYTIACGLRQKQILLHQTVVSLCCHAKCRAIVLEYCTRTWVHFLQFSYSNVKVLRLEQKLGPTTQVHYESYHITIKKNYLSTCKDSLIQFN